MIEFHSNGDISDRNGMIRSITAMVLLGLVLCMVIMPTVVADDGTDMADKPVDFISCQLSCTEMYTNIEEIGGQSFIVIKAGQESDFNACTNTCLQNILGFGFNYVSGFSKGSTSGGSGSSSGGSSLGGSSSGGFSSGGSSFGGSRSSGSSFGGSSTGSPSTGVSRPSVSNTGGSSTSSCGCSG